MPVPPSCVCCWNTNKPCLQDPLTLICRRCRLRKAWGLPVVTAPRLYDAVVFEVLYKHVIKDSSLSSLSVEPGGMDFNNFDINITPSTSGITSTLAMHINGTFDTQNEILMAQLDGLVKGQLAVRLRDKDVESHTIYFAVIAGGYIHLLCSSLFTEPGTERVKTTVDWVDCPNDYTEHNLRIHFQALVFCRLREYVETSLGIIQDGCCEGAHPDSATASHASAALLRKEIVYFMNSLKHGRLSDKKNKNLSPRMKIILIEWFTLIEAELSQRLLNSCGQYPAWHKAIDGQNKLIRRKEETISVTFSLHINKWTYYEQPPPAPAYTYLSNHDAFFTSPQQSPALQVPAMSYDIPDGLEQLPFHASEAPVVAVSDPFLDFQSLLRRVDEEYPLID